jgi:methylenetetrahydrofolate dehydrogenase (NADP+) / methenyltetrahydrofolate cyclohydrolase
MSKILDGKALSEKIITKIRQEMANLENPPGLAAILVGEDSSSRLYVDLKKKACQKCGINFHEYLFDEDQTTQNVIETIKFLNKDPETNGILVQLPLPDNFDTEKIIEAIDYRKDIDGFHPKNRENMDKCVYKVLPPLPAGIKELLDSTKETIENKTITVLCNNPIFGSPFKYLYGTKNKVNVVTPKDKTWKQNVSDADILISSVGVPYLIDKEMIKKDSTIIDVGINKLDNGETVGDVNIADVIDKVAHITPVPGGVGPMTVAMLLKNLIQIAKH